jgi:hypothetical protein
MCSENDGVGSKETDKETLEVLGTILKNSPAKNMSPKMENLM